MSSWLPERRIRCPFCGEPMTLVVDPSAGSQSYIEDCQICCQPMHVTVTVDGDEVSALVVER